MFDFYQTRQEDIFCQLTINNSFPPHLHKQMEILFIQKGEILSTISGKERKLHAGDISICFPNTIHSTVTESYSEAIMLIFDISCIPAFTNELIQFFPESPFLTEKQNSEKYKIYFDMILSSYHNKEDFRILIGYLYIILGKLLSSLTLIRQDKAGSQNTCNLILKYIHNHFTENLSLNSVSKELGISKYYISHLFSEKIQTPFPSYLNRCRIDYAKNLLLNTEDSITDIGFNAGFNSARTFYRTFREHCNITPKEFRKINTLK